MIDYEPTTAADVTEELVEITAGIINGWYLEGRVDWENVWDRVEKARLEDGRGIALGSNLLSPALKALKKRALAASDRK